MLVNNVLEEEELPSGRQVAIPWNLDSLIDPDFEERTPVGTCHADPEEAFFGKPTPSTREVPERRNIGEFSQLLIDEGLEEAPAPQLLSKDLFDFNVDLLMTDQ